MPIFCLNVTYPLVPEELVAFCSGRRAVLVVEEGQPAYLEDALLAILRRHAVADVRVLGKGGDPGRPCCHRPASTPER